MERQVNNLIIGAGPAGLATAGRMRKKGLDFVLIEQSDKISSSWHGHYDRLCLHTVRELSHLPHLPIPDSYPRYLPRLDLIKYFDSYVEHFKIKAELNTKLNTVFKNPQGDWECKISHAGEDKTIIAKHVVFATGVNRVPHKPTWDGLDSFQGEIVHSRNYKRPNPFVGKKVLVIGFGNTGAEIALDLAENNIECAVVIRSEINVVPRDLNGRPTQLTGKMLEKFPFGLGDWLGTQIRKVYYGDLTPYGIKPSKLPPAAQLKKTGKTPVIDLGTIQMIKEGKIKVFGDIEKFSADSVHFTDGKVEAFDALILATGYQARLAEFIPGIEEFLDPYHVPLKPIATNDFDGLYFVGFDNYKLGGIIGTIHTDSETVVKHIDQKA